MITRIQNIIVVSILFFTTISTYAQSLNYAKSLIELGKYLEAAKQLRPLADGGNAEAQYLAANLFFTGRGVTKNVAQGEKYAKLSANQGYEDAIILLSTRYFNSENHQQLFSFLSEQIDKHPYMETEVPGSILALCYTNGYGTEKNYYKGYRILSQNEAWMAQLEEKAPEFASVAPSIISKFSISNVYGCDQGSQNRTPVYASNEYVGVNYSFKSSRPHTHPLFIYVYDTNRNRVGYWNATLNINKADNAFYSQSKIGPLAEGNYTIVISEPDASVIYGQKSFSVLSLAQKEESEWQQKAAKTQVEVRRGGLINARLENSYWRNGSLYVEVAVTTPMVRRQFRMGSPYVRGAYTRSVRATLRGLNQEPGRDYYIITDKDVAYITFVVSGQPKSGELSEVGVDMSLSGTKEYVKVKNLVWR